MKKEAHWFSLKGEVISSITVTGMREVSIRTKSGRHIELNHFQDCCENVRIVMIEKYIPYLPFGPITIAEDDHPADPAWYTAGYGDDSHTWTRFRLVDGEMNELNIWWLGESNGYYAESVSVTEVS